VTTRRQRGYQTEEILAAYLRRQGFAGAEPTTRGAPGTDILGIPAVVIEVKAKHANPLVDALNQARANCHTADDIPIAVWRRDGDGPTNVHQWVVATDVATIAHLLAEAGYQ
jgi:hypothetical protein